MAQSKKKGGSAGSASSEVGLGKRLIVILYAAGIVVIGAYPIQREFGSVYNFLDIKLRQYAGTALPGSGRSTTGGSLTKDRAGIGQYLRGLAPNGKAQSPASGKSGGGRLDDPEVRRLRVGSRSSARNALESDMDHINSRDKAALDDLIVEKAR